MASLTPLALGPVEILVALFDGADSMAGIRLALHEQMQRGSIRLLDAVVVSRNSPGEIEWSEIDSYRTGTAKLPAEFPVATLELLTPGLTGDDDIRRLAENVPVGRCALVIVFELTSARRLAERISHSGAGIVASEFIPAQFATAMLEFAHDQQ